MEPESREQSIGKGYKYLATGMRFAGGIVVFMFLGLLLDRWLHTLPLFLLIGVFLGGGLAFLSVYRELMADSANKPTWRGGRTGGQRDGGTEGPRDGGTEGQRDGRTGGRMDGK